VISVSIAVVMAVDTDTMVIGRVLTKVVVDVETEMEMLSIVTVLVCISRMVSVTVVTGQVEAAAWRLRRSSGMLMIVSW
jgi:hypothetical protein